MKVNLILSLLLFTCNFLPAQEEQTVELFDTIKTEGMAELIIIVSILVVIVGVFLYFRKLSKQEET